MDVAALILFASTLLLAAASPGPGVAALVARVVGRGARGAGAFAAGLILGDLVWLAVAILGLAVVAQTFHEVFLVIKYAGAGYLAYLAYRMWTAPIRPRDVARYSRDASDEATVLRIEVEIFIVGLLFWLSVFSGGRLRLGIGLVELGIALKYCADKS